MIFVLDGDAIGHPDSASAAEDFASSQNPQWSLRETWPNLILARSTAGDSFATATYVDEDRNRYLDVKLVLLRNGWFVESYKACQE